MKIYEATKLREELATAFPQGSVVPAHTSRGHYYNVPGRETSAPSVTTIQSIESKGYLKQWAVNKAVEYIDNNIARLCGGDLNILEEAKKAHERELLFAGSVGTTAHDAAEKYAKHWIETGEKKESAVEFLAEGSLPEEVAGTRSFDKFIKEHDLIPIASEVRVWYAKGKDVYAGTVDAIYLMGEVYKDKEGDASCAHDYEQQKGNKHWCVKCGRVIVWKLVEVDYKTSNSVAGKNSYGEQVEAYARAIEQRTGWKFDDLWILQLNKQRAKYDLFKVNDRTRAWKRFLATLRHYVETQDANENLLTPREEKLIIRI
jgi:hypothetical protein